MARRLFAIDQTQNVTQMHLDDGTVHYRVDYLVRPVGERVYLWTLRSLWALAGAVLVAAAFTL